MGVENHGFGRSVRAGKVPCTRRYRGVVGLDHGCVWEWGCTGEYIARLGTSKLRLTGTV